MNLQEVTPPNTIWQCGTTATREEEKEEEGEEEKQKVVEEGGRETTVIDAPLSPSNKARSVLWRTVRPGAPAMPAMAPRCSSGNARHGDATHTVRQYIY